MWIVGMQESRVDRCVSLWCSNDCIPNPIQSTVAYNFASRVARSINTIARHFGKRAGHPVLLRIFSVSIIMYGQKKIKVK